MNSAVAIWLGAFRLRTLFLALACMVMGNFLAAAERKFDWLVFILSVLTATFLQILSNLSNDYGDFIHGADSPTRLGPKRAVHSGDISSAAMKKAIWFFSILSLFTGIALLIVAIDISSLNFLIFLIIGLLAILAAIKYTAGDNPYGYSGLGDISVFIFFGLVGVLGTFYLQTQTLNVDLLLPAASCGLFSVAVLNVNNIRDIESDKHAGKKSIPVRIGRRNAVIYHWILLIAGVASTVIYTLSHYQHLFQWLFLLSLPLLFLNGIMVGKIKDPVKLNPYLKQMAIGTLVFVLSFGIGLLLSTSFAF